MKKLGLGFLLIALATGCGAVSNGGDGTPTPTPTPAAGIANIQQGNVTPGSTVTLTGVIVTAVDPGPGGGIDFFIQDVGGGPFSGIYVFDAQANSPAELAIGDEVDVSGVYTEYQGTSTDTISEITPDTVTITNSGLAPTVDSIPVADLGEALGGTAAEDWEGCLIEIGGTVNVVNAAVGFGQFSVGNGTETILVDDVIFTDAEVGRSNNEAITHLAGVWTYSFSEYKLLPRSSSDVIGTILAPVTKTIVMVQNTSDVAHPLVGTPIILEDAIVTAAWTPTGGTDANKRHVFVQQGPAALYNGIFIFPQDKLITAAVTTGYVLDITGKYTEFNGLAELVLDTANGQSASVTIVTGTPAGIVPLDVTLPTLLANPEPYEGVLVRITGPALTCSSNNIGFGEFSIWSSAAGPRLAVDDTIWTAAETGMTNGRSFPTGMVGIFYYSFGAYKLEPRSSLDYAP